MFCNHCGEQLASSAQGCWSCNTPVSGAGFIAPAVQYTVLPQRVGLGGWLLVFWLGCTFLSPLLYLSRAVESGDPLFALFATLVAGFGVTSGYFIHQNDPRALRWLEGFFGVGLAYGLVLFISAWRAHGLHGEQSVSVVREFVKASKVIFYNLGWWT